MTAIDEKRWEDLESFLHPDFVCRLVHTGESFDRDGWIRFNSGYPGFEHLTVEDLVADQAEAACRTHVTGRSEAGAQHFECASFARMGDGLIVQLTEVWTDVEQQAPLAPARRLLLLAERSAQHQVHDHGDDSHNGELGNEPQHREHRADDEPRDDHRDDDTDDCPDVGLVHVSSVTAQHPPSH